MGTYPRTAVEAHGVRVLLSRHAQIRKLKRRFTPSAHGDRFWNSSWLLMDYFEHHGLPGGTRVMEVGCGWGLAGIYCAKNHGATVTGVDSDPDVFPFLRLHADLNQVKISTLERGMGGLTLPDLEGVEVLMGADICFWDSLVLSLKRLIGRALRVGVRLIVIADPGRPTFENLVDYFKAKGPAEQLDWHVCHPRSIHGRLLQIGPL